MQAINDPADLLTQRIADLEKELALQKGRHDDSDQKLMATAEKLCERKSSDNG